MADTLIDVPAKKPAEDPELVALKEQLQRAIRSVQSAAWDVEGAASSIADAAGEVEAALGDPNEDKRIPLDRSREMLDALLTTIEDYRRGIRTLPEVLEAADDTRTAFGRSSW